MAKTVDQKVVFKNTTAKKLYDLYMNAKQHSFVTGGPAKMSAKAGSKFSVFGGYAIGKTLHFVKNELIVQTWRASDWDKDAPDSVLTLSFEQKGKDAVLYATHANLPDSEAKSIDKGWFEHYWNVWKQHLAGKTITRPGM